ncbi:MAG: ABC transporter ATP-binding protein [Deltaproteobacteria bacterium]
MNDYRRLFRFLKPHVGLFGLAGLFMALSALFDGVSLTMVLPLADKVLANKQIILPGGVPPGVAAIIDRINAMSPAVLLNYLAVGIIIVTLLKETFLFLQGYLMNVVSQKVITDLRCKLYSKMQSLSLDYFTHQRGGELMSRVTNDVHQVGTVISSGLVDLIYQSFLVAVFASIIFVFYFRLAFVAIVILPLISIPMVKVSKTLKKIFGRGQAKIADINSILYETILGQRVIKAFNAEAYEQAKFDQANRDYYKLNLKSAKRVLLSGPVTEFIAMCAVAFILIWQGRQVLANQLSFGVLALSLGALVSMFRPFKKLSQVNGQVQQGIASAARIYEVLDTEPTVKESRDAVRLEGFRTGITFENVCFSYETNEVLRGIDLDVKMGEVVAIVGPSGAGKTTLLDMIPRFYDPAKGRLLIDGKDIKAFALSSLRSHIAIVTQETILFNDTVRANIAYGLSNARQEDIERAAQQAHIHDVIMQLPEGYDTLIGDRGTKLSGGERQRLAIARALLKNAPILILDEATSQLDTQSERLVQEALNRLMVGRTVFVIAHRLSTVRNANRIAVLDGGKIIEIGTHDELLRKADGLYKRLYLNQGAQMDEAKA